MEEATGEQLLVRQKVSNSSRGCGCSTGPSHGGVHGQNVGGQGTCGTTSGVGHGELQTSTCGTGRGGGCWGGNREKDEDQTVNTVGRRNPRGRKHRRRGLQSVAEPRQNLDRERRGHNPCYHEDDYSTDEELHPFDVRALTAEQEKTKIAANPPHYVFLRRPDDPSKWKDGKYPIWCEDCRKCFADCFYESPLNLVFRFKCIVHWYEKGGIRRHSSDIQTAHFHSADLGCLKNVPELELLTKKDLYIEQACYSQLTEDHINLLHRCRHWVPVRQNRAKVIQNKF